MEIATLLEKEKEVMMKQFEVKLQELQDQIDYGSIGNTKWLEDRCGMTFVLVRDRILYPFRKELEGRIVSYPERQGAQWKVNKWVFNQWIVENFHRVSWNG